MPSLVRIEPGDCLTVIPRLVDEGVLVDAIVCDPPYGLEFMGKEWDSFADVRKATRGTLTNMVNPNGAEKFKTKAPAFDLSSQGRASFQEWTEAWARAAMAILKPGGYLLAFGGTRTYHRMTCAIEDAGFEIRDAIMWHYGTGFPKSLNVSKAIDRAAGAEREVVATVRYKGGGTEHINRSNAAVHDYRPDGYQKGENILDVTAPATDAAREWEGWGTALKPATEIICVARKPLSERAVAANVLKHGTGALNIDECRVGFEDTANAATNPLYRVQNGYRTEVGSDANGSSFSVKRDGGNVTANQAGRWPANLVLSPDGGQYELRGNVSGEQRAELYRWLSENP